ncbi:MAG: sensor domain-containing diguanylate cyclase [Woeseiaceae bacterium]
MITPPTPVDELLRLETLRNLKILDTEAEERFDRVTRLAKRIFGAEIALVSLVDSDRQWFKSYQGIDVTETPRDVSFCGHAILDDKVMVVNDAHTDERFRDNPLVSADPKIRFYAGCPISAPNGSKLGTLCVIDSKPRDTSDEDITLLEELGQLVEEELAMADMMHDDPVTGLSNNLGFAQIAEYLLAMSVRTDSPATLMLFRVANQNVITGFMGQEEGDRAAIEMTQMLMASFRDSDIIGRLTHDAFAVLMAGASLENVEVARQRIEAAIEERNLRGESEYELDVETAALAYDPDSHADVSAMINDVEDRLEEGRGQDSANYAGIA